MKILQIASNYNISDVYRCLFEALSKDNSLITIIPLTIKGGKNSSFQEDTEGIKPLYIGKPRIFGNQINAPKYLNSIIEHGYLNEVDLVHAHFILNDGLIAYKIYKRFKIPYIVSVRTSCINVLKKKIAFHNYISSLFVLNYASTIVFQSYVFQNKLLSEIPWFLKKRILNKSQIISNGIDTFWHKHIYKKRNLPIGNRFSILTVASIEQNKNLLSIAKITSKLNSDGYNVIYNIVGPIIDKKIYDKLTSIQNVQYYGALGKENLLQVYRQSDIFVMVSHRETFGMVFAEAMSQGLPIVYTKGEGFDGQFKEGLVGYHASSNSEIEIENAILNVLANYQQLSENALKFSGTFRWENISDRFTAIYRCLMNK